MKIAFIFLFLLTLTHAQTWRVVCSKKIKIENLKELKSFYFKKRRYSNGVKVVPLNLSFSHPARRAFMQDVLSVQRVFWQRYWDKMHFKGVDTPVVVESIEAMKMYLLKVPGSVGYLPSSMESENFYEIGHFESK